MYSVGLLRLGLELNNKLDSNEWMNIIIKSGSNKLSALFALSMSACKRFVSLISFIYLFFLCFFLFISFYIVLSVLYLRVYDDIHFVASGLGHSQQPKYWYFSVIFIHIIFILHATIYTYIVNWCSLFAYVFFVSIRSFLLIRKTQTDDIQWWFWI